MDTTSDDLLGADRRRHPRAVGMRARVHGVDQGKRMFWAYAPGAAEAMDARNDRADVATAVRRESGGSSQHSRPGAGRGRRTDHVIPRGADVIGNVFEFLDELGSNDPRIYSGHSEHCNPKHSRRCGARIHVPLRRRTSDSTILKTDFASRAEPLRGLLARRRAGCRNANRAWRLIRRNCEDARPGWDRRWWVSAQVAAFWRPEAR